jgi:hypothetical protein
VSVRLVVSAGWALVFAAVVLLCPVGARAAVQTLVVPTVASPPPLDPKADVATWAQAASVTLSWDVQHQKPSSELSVAHIATDATYLYVRFDNAQHEPLWARQHTNDIGDGTDDEIWVDLWPNGPNGFYYQFAATSNGTHFQYSTENTAYDPTWWSYGAAHPDGSWTTTEKIPLKVVRGSGSSGGWRIQFVRIVRSTGERQIWSWGPLQTNGDDVTYAAPTSGMAPAAVSRATPRVGVYGLGALGSPGSGLSTSRMGADFSVPVTATSSIYGTLHPDFSNVEVDQQTIAPTAYQRVYTEVRPFFTQGANYYDPFDCDVCPYTAQLYTPSIPTPRDGYAFEGKQGLFSFAGFDAVGLDRDDGAEMVQMHTPNNQWSYAVQQVDVDLPGIVDHTITSGVHFNDAKHWDAFFNYGEDLGTDVLDDSRNKRIDGGAYYYTNTFGMGASLRSFGEYYQPLDGYVTHPDIAGYAIFENKEWLFPATSWLDSIQFWSFVDRYHDHTGALDQTDNNLSLDVLTHGLIDVQGGIGSSYLKLPNGIFSPVSQDGIQFTWHSGSANNPGNNGNHGSSATPTVISWNGGRFGPGRLNAWLRSSTMRAGQRGTITFEVDDTDQQLDSGARNEQWLERLSYNYLIGQNSSVAFGIRRIDGTAPLIFTLAPPTLINAWNVSFDYHKRWGPNELYFAYGDASQVYTVHEFIVKLIRYVGAEKGT